MSKSIKLTDNTYWDSSCISRNKVGLNSILDGKQDNLKSSGWNYVAANVYYKTYGNVVTIKCDTRGNGVTLKVGTYTSVGTLPQSVRPTSEIPFVFHFIGGNPEGQSAFVRTNGNIELYTASNNRGYYAFSITYVI